MRILTQQVKAALIAWSRTRPARSLPSFAPRFFLFFTLAEVLDIWLYRWAAFAIVFAGMLLLAGIFALIGLKQVKQVKKPEATIDSFGKIPEVVPSGSSKTASSKNVETAEGLYS